MGEQGIPRVKQICHGISLENLGGIVTEFDSKNELHKQGFYISNLTGLLQLV
jgi:hypothetical protein